MAKRKRRIGVRKGMRVRLPPSSTESVVTFTRDKNGKPMLIVEHTDTGGIVRMPVVPSCGDAGTTA